MSKEVFFKSKVHVILPTGWNLTKENIHTQKNLNMQFFPTH